MVVERLLDASVFAVNGLLVHPSSLATQLYEFQDSILLLLMYRIVLLQNRRHPRSILGHNHHVGSDPDFTTMSNDL